MATDKTYSVCGITRQPDGKVKVRWTNNIMRIKILVREGHTDIELADLGKPMTKYEGVMAIKGLPEFQKAHCQEAIAEYLEEKAPKSARPAVNTATAVDTAQTEAV
jgi:Tfp pilus assembly pilus retraction ATPase PilT